MTATHDSLDRNASHLVLQLSDLRVNQRLSCINDAAQFVRLALPLLQLAADTKRYARELGINRLVLVGLGGCVTPALHTAEPELDSHEAMFAALRLLKLLLAALGSQFHIEVFGLTGCVLAAGCELAMGASNTMRYTDALIYHLLKCDLQGIANVVFRGFEEEALLLNVGASRLMWRYQYDLDGPTDLPIQSSLNLAEAARLEG